jgi:hypothetical protein
MIPEPNPEIHAVGDVFELNIRRSRRLHFRVPPHYWNIRHGIRLRLTHQSTHSISVFKISLIYNKKYNFTGFVTPIGIQIIEYCPMKWLCVRSYAGKHWGRHCTEPSSAWITEWWESEAPIISLWSIGGSPPPLNYSRFFCVTLSGRCHMFEYELWFWITEKRHEGRR